MSGFNVGRLLLPKAEYGVCDHCGDTYPINPGDKIFTCQAWVDTTIGRLPQPMNFDTLLNLKMFAKLCNITVYIQRGLEALDEVEGRG